jgi:hypothetical protein
MLIGKSYIIFCFAVVFSAKLIGQEEKVFEIKIAREVNSENKIESFIEIRDSVIAFIELLKERWGEEPENNGIIEWKNVNIDSIEGKIQVKLYHFIVKQGEPLIKTVTVSKKTKQNEIRVIRLRFLQKQNDLLSSIKLTENIREYFNNLYKEIVNEDDNMEYND